MKGNPTDLERAIASADLAAGAAGQQLDWSRVRRGVYLVHQRFAYRYPGAIERLRHRLMILPPRHYGDQRLLEHRLTVTSRAAATTYDRDPFGNTQIVVAVPRVARAITFEAWMLVERRAADGPRAVTASAATLARYLRPSPLTQPDAALTAIARRFRASHPRGAQPVQPAQPAQPAQLAHALNTWVYQTMRYAHGVTGITTTAAEALALGQGVCQDYAHIMAALCRLCGLPARYVSGHLLGEGGTHAWVEVLVPVEGQPGQYTALALDPTHGAAVGLNYVTIATGRDYADVAPTSGTYLAAYPGQLTAHKRVGLTAVEYAEYAPQPDDSSACA